MSKKITKNNVKALTKAMDVGAKAVMVRVDDIEIEINVSNMVNSLTMRKMVDTVAGTVVRDGEYDSSVYETACWATILCNVANFPDDLDDNQWEQLCCCDELRAAVEAYWNANQAAHFWQAAEKAVQHAREDVLNTNKSRLDAITSQLEITTSYMQAVTSSLEKVDPEMMVGMINKLSGMNELDLGNAVIDIRDAQKKRDKQ